MEKITLKKIGSAGVVMGKIFVVEEKDLTAKADTVSDKEKAKEVTDFKEAHKKALEEIEVLAEESDIFKAHLNMIQDDSIVQGTIDKIDNDNKNAQAALKETEDSVAAIFEMMEDDEYMRERATDIRDICKRIMAHLKGVDLNVFKHIKEEVVIVAKDLTPSDTSNMDFDKVKGFITVLGGVTGHVCIIARNIGIPAVVGMSNAFEILKKGDFVILDASHKTLIINPDEQTVAEYTTAIEQYHKTKEEFKTVLGLPTQTLDAHHVELFANVGGYSEAEAAVNNGAEGIGLFRTEFLYMESDELPSEETQFEVYKNTAALFEGKPIIIRTLDIGGDKDLKYFDIGKEENPFLGFRAIRICLAKKDMFKTQLRALLRASAFGKVMIMYPMIISLEEYRDANEILRECKEELTAEGHYFDPLIQTGIMIETPASVINALDLAKEVDFFSIGTNDLTQYLLAVDRGNDKISDMYDSFHPAVLRSIKHVIDAGHKYGRIVGMCGEFAGNRDALPILLGMGLNEFSVSSIDIAELKYKIRNTNYSQAVEYAHEILKFSTLADVKFYLQTHPFYT